MKFLFFITLILTSFSTLACRCAMQDTKSKFQHYDFVYFGKVISSQLISEDKVKNEMEIIESFKGTSNTIMYSFLPDSRCSPAAAVGFTYIVYGKYNEEVQLKFCSASQPMDQHRNNNFDKEIIALRKLATTNNLNK